MDKEKTPYGSQSLNRFIEESIRSNWERVALSDIDADVSFTFGETAEYIEKIHILFRSAGLRPGDKVAICGRNSSSWAVTFLACLTFGAVAVPILHEFNPESVCRLVDHSDARLMFTDAQIWEKITDAPARLEGAFAMSGFSLLFSKNGELTQAHDNLNLLFGERFPGKFGPDDVSYFRDTPDETCLINYTSGSTGSPKGVMLPFRSLWSNIRYSIDGLTFLKPGDGMVCMLPLGHLYGMVFEMLHPFVKGCHCYFLGKTPSPGIILKAFARVRPKLVITVPLVLEKIIKSRVFPQLRKPMMRFLLAIPGIRGIILSKIRAKLIDVFGGQLLEVIIGGAPLNAEVEKFLYEIKFPVTVGYGMTECGPLITYAPSHMSRPHTVGRVVDRMKIRVDSPDPAKVPGNIYVSGDNVMSGYYKNPEATREAFPMGDGWMNTGDMGTVSPDGTVAINGRSKTMILGTSGQNIYPEEIEQLINNMPYVNESLVIDDHGKLVALIHPDFDAAEKAGLDRKALETTLDHGLKNVNRQLESYNRLSSMRIMDKEFEKTPKRSIKRFLYQA